MTEAQLITAIEVFRKETEDLVNTIVKEMFMIQYGEVNLTADTPATVEFTLYTYLNANDYELILFSATDTDGTNILDAIERTGKTTGGFTILSPRDSTVRWQTTLKVPFKDFLTP